MNNFTKEFSSFTNFVKDPKNRKALVGGGLFAAGYLIVSSLSKKVENKINNSEPHFPFDFPLIKSIDKELCRKFVNFTSGAYDLCPLENREEYKEHVMEAMKNCEKLLEIENQLIKGNKPKDLLFLINASKVFSRETMLAIRKTSACFSSEYATRLIKSHQNDLMSIFCFHYTNVVALCDQNLLQLYE